MSSKNTRPGQLKLGKEELEGKRFRGGRKGSEKWGERKERRRRGEDEKERKGGRQREKKST